MKRNPSTTGYLCTFFREDRTGNRDERPPFVVLNRTREEVVASLKKSGEGKYDKFEIVQVNVFS